MTLNPVLYLVFASMPWLSVAQSDPIDSREHVNLHGIKAESQKKLSEATVGQQSIPRFVGTDENEIEGEAEFSRFESLYRPALESAQDVQRIQQQQHLEPASR